jgi:hypothetical protein
MAAWSTRESTEEVTTKGIAAEASERSVAEDPVDMVRFRRLIDASSRLREAGLTHDEIDRRARRDAITFNEAVEFLDREIGHA